MQAIATILFLTLFASSVCYSKELSLTFDDGPSLFSPILGQKSRSLAIRKALKENGVNQVMMFTTTGTNKEKTQTLLLPYVKEGHLVANHTVNHPDYSKTSTEVFRREVQGAHEIIKALPTFAAFFRFPMLRHGNDHSKRTAGEKILKKLGYRHGWVTIDNSEWAVEAELRAAKNRGDKINHEKLCNVYKSHLVGEAEYFYALGERHVGKDIRHTLLLHENDVAGFCLAALIDALKRAGWKISSPLEVYSDALYHKTPKTDQLNQGLIMALAIDAGYTGPTQQESEKALRKRLKNSGAFTPR